MPEAAAGPRFVTFGESQGGQAALFTGQLAAEYAPELDLVGVAAAAPATDLNALFRRSVGTTFTNIDAPVFIAWGGADPLVLPAIQDAFVDAWCERGQRLEYRIYEGVGHIDSGHASAADVAQWFGRLLEGTGWEPTCNADH